MSTESLTEKIARQRVPLGVVLGIALIVGLAILTIALQLLKWIDVFTNLTDIWLFFVVLPLLTIAAALIGYGVRASASKIVREETQVPMPAGVKPEKSWDYLKNLEDKLGLSASLHVYSQEQLHELQEFLSSATQEIDFVGVGLEVVASSIDVIMERIDHGVTIRVILPANNKELIDRIEWTYGLSNLKGVIDRTFELLLNKRMELPSVDSGKLDILNNNIVFPVYGMVLLDPNSDDAVIRVEIYLVGVDPGSRPILFIRKKEQPALFEKYFKSYRFILKRCE